MRLITKRKLLKRLLPFKKELGISRYSSVGEFSNLGVHVVNCVRTKLRKGQISSTQGASVRLDSALCISILEGVERYCAANFNLEYIERKSLKSMRKSSFPLDQLGYSNASGKLHWIRAKELYTGKALYIPAKEVLFPFDLKEDTAFIKAGTSGLACGASKTESQIYGVMEVVERYTMSRFYMEAVKRKTGSLIKLSSISDPLSKELIYRLVHNGYKVFVFEIDAIFPTYHVVIFDAQNMGPKYGVSGSSTNYNFMLALRRAVYEAIQSLVVSLQGVREDLMREKGKYLVSYIDGERQFNAKYKCLECLNGSKNFEENHGATVEFGSQDNCYEYIFSKLSDIGVKSIYNADLSKDLHPVFTSKTIIPELPDFYINSYRFR